MKSKTGTIEIVTSGHSKERVSAEVQCSLQIYSMEFYHLRY